ncbi:uncharacterized protein LOC142345283 [Convolutriloba macropyga]|uniref:uncharacterized protein LOC142345283 n=1 Tax=Convolutriloba macropyga TaxID=536237 RepID=UPI003F526A20
MPGLILSHYVVTEHNQDYGDFKECFSCFRQHLFAIEIYGRIPLVHFPTIAISALLYLRCVKKLKASKQIQRKGLLIRVFILLLVSWTLLVTPHVVLQDLILEGKWFSFGTLMNHQYYDTFYENNWEHMQRHHSAEYWSSQREKHNLLVAYSVAEPILRILKMSFGFVNSILLIILIKPFHEPLIVWKKWFAKQFGRNNLDG